MSALGYGCLQINLRIGIFQLQSSQQFHCWSLLCIALCVFILGKMENLKLKRKYQISERVQLVAGFE